MAQFCVEHGMGGCTAARNLDETLKNAGIPDWEPQPVYGYFEEKK